MVLIFILNKLNESYLEKISYHFFIDKIVYKSKKEKLTIVIEDNSKINFKKIKDQIKSCTKLEKHEIPKYITLHKIHTNIQW